MKQKILSIAINSISYGGLKKTIDGVLQGLDISVLKMNLLKELSLANDSSRLTKFAYQTILKMNLFSNVDLSRYTQEILKVQPFEKIDNPNRMYNIDELKDELMKPIPFIESLSEYDLHKKIDYLVRKRLDDRFIIGNIVEKIILSRDANYVNLMLSMIMQDADKINTNELDMNDLYDAAKQKTGIRRFGY